MPGIPEGGARAAVGITAQLRALPHALPFILLLQVLQATWELVKESKL